MICRTVVFDQRGVHREGYQNHVSDTSIKWHELLTHIGCGGPPY